MAYGRSTGRANHSFCKTTISPTLNSSETACVPLRVVISPRYVIDHPDAFLFIESESGTSERLLWENAQAARIVNGSHWYDVLTGFGVRQLNQP